MTDNTWRVNIHEPIIWALADFYNKLQMDRLPKSSSVAQVDPEIHIKYSLSSIELNHLRDKVHLYGPFGMQVET